MTRRTLTCLYTIRPEKKRVAEQNGMPGLSGASRDSPSAEDDNDEVRQRAGSALNSYFRFHTNFRNPYSCTNSQPLMHLPQHRFPSPAFLPMLSVRAEHDLTDEEQLSENNDFCSACGGSGFLLCCDGCDRSFHFSCLDPPLNDDASELNEPWFCYICVAKRPITAESPEKPQRGLFAPLLSSLKKRNPSNFALPPEIRDYFEGVATDKNGAFLEALNTRTR